MYKSSQKNYANILIYEGALAGHKVDKKDFDTWIAKNISTVATPQIISEFMQKLSKTFQIKLSPQDIHHAKTELNKLQTPGLKDIISTLKSQGHKILIIGGGTWGCAIIPEFAKQFGIEKTDIYSGYFKDFSDSEVKKTLFDRYRYANCGNLELKTPISEKKSDLIKLLKKEAKIKGKIIHIGDGENDLEVWKAGEADVFIGFGVNRYSKKVEAESEIYVKTMEGFREEIERVAHHKPFSQKSQMQAKDLIKLMEAGSWNGWNLHGKTGSSDFDKSNVREGYFVGFAEKNSEVISFVIHTSGDIGDKDAKTGGLQAKKILLDRIIGNGIFND